MSISFEVFAKDTVYNCDNDNFRDYASQRWMKQTLKVEDPLFGERKLFIRKEGVWKQLCTQEEDVITDDSFKCFEPTSPENTSYPKLNNAYEYYLIFDEQIAKFFSETLSFTCTKSE